MNWSENKTVQKTSVSLRHTVLFAMLAAIAFLSDLLLDFAMNVELVSTLFAAYTLVYRKRALYIIYLYSMLYLLFYGFAPVNLAYLYLWLFLWGTFMLLPRKMSRVSSAFLCPLCCSLFGLAFGLLYTPVWALSLKLTFDQTVVWWVSGLFADAVHAVGNAVFGMLIVPLSRLLFRLEERFS